MHVNRVTIRLEYRDGSMVIPINPENIKVSRASASISAEVIGLGEIAVPQSPGLAEIDIESFFWRYWFEVDTLNSYQYQTAKEYADWFKIWQRSKLPAQWTVEELGYNLWVTCEAFNYDVRAGEEDDTYYELSLKEYRDYGAQVIKLNQATQTAAPVAAPRIDTKPAVEQTYTVKSGDSLWAISKRLSNQGGTNWGELYEANKAVIGNNPSFLRIGTTLVIPAAWVTA